MYASFVVRKCVQVSYDNNVERERFLASQKCRVWSRLAVRRFNTSDFYFYFFFAAAKKLPCNHIFHTSCLRSWFQRQQTCPTCRLNILRTPASAAATAAAAGAGAAGAPQAAPAAGAAVAPAGGAVGAAAAPAGQPPRFRDRTAQTNGAAASGQTPRLRDRTAQTNGAAATSAQQARLRDRTAQTYGQFPIPGTYLQIILYLYLSI